MPRLDELLVSRGFYATRARARDAVIRGAVNVAGRIATKPGAAVAEDAPIALADPARAYVSRAALKLLHGLDSFAIDPRGLRCLDLGASTGGFTQALLERGAAHVTAVEVGHGQLAEGLARDPRVTSIEGFNARHLGPADLASAPELIVADLSFISLKLALPPALHLAAPGAWLVALVKPQFEAGRQYLDKAGVVRDRAVREAAARDIGRWIERDRGWRLIGTAESPVAGGGGNREYLLGAAKP